MEVAQLERRIGDWRLAVDGGTRVRPKPMPRRLAFGDAETAMLEEAVRVYRADGIDPGYQGIYEKRYTDAFVEMMGGGYADAVATGTGAIFVALAALDLPAGSEVMVSPITDPGTLSAIVLNGLIPRLGDARPEEYNIGVEQVLQRLTPDVSAVVVVHTFGRAAEIDRIAEVSRKQGIRVVEDCSQSHGATLDGRPVGTFGDIATFSTMHRKIHMTGGSGGVVYARDLETFRRALAHADRGKPRWQDDFDDRNPETYLWPALNWHSDELSCAIGIASLSRLGATIARRLAFVADLTALLGGLDTMFRPAVWQPSDAPFVLPVFVDLEQTGRRKTQIAEAVRAEGIDLNPDYRYLASDWPWLRPYLADRFETPNARSSRDRSFCLYLNENYGAEEAADVAAALLKVHRACAKAHQST